MPRRSRPLGQVVNTTSIPMTDTRPRDLIKLLIDALKKECNWIDNPKHDELIAKANIYLAQYEPEVSTDEELNSKSSPNNLQIRSSDLNVTIALLQQWSYEIYGGPGAVFGSDDICLAKLAAQYGADQELEACVDWISKQDWTWTSAQLRAARRPKPTSLKDQALKALAEADLGSTEAEWSQRFDTIRRALEALPDD